MPTVEISTADEDAHFRACWDMHLAELRAKRPGYMLIWPERLPLPGGSVRLFGVPDAVIDRLESLGVIVRRA